MVDRNKLTRRQFIKNAAMAGTAVAAGNLIPQTSASAQTPTTWDLTADVVVIGSGAAGMCAAIAARDAGASVLVVEENYDIGGKAIMSGGGTFLGGGTAVQKANGITDTADLLFEDLTSPAATNAASNGSKYVDRALNRVLADNSAATFDFLIKNGVQFTQTAVPNTPLTSPTQFVSGTPRGLSPYWNGSASFPASAASPGGANGTGLMRPLEASARAKGVQFLLNYKMISIVREQPYSGKVLGVTANATGGRTVPGSSAPLQPFVPQGNAQLGAKAANIRANKAVIVATGGSSSNVQRRREVDPRLTDVYSTIGDPYCFQTGDGEYAARRIGASLWATANETAENDTELTKPTWIGCQYGHGAIKWNPSSPIFPLVRATGLIVADWGDIVHVNMAGLRFADESAPNYPWITAAMCKNAASKAPDWAAGPIWAIFDSGAVTREKWALGSPNTDPQFFFQANDIPTLAQQISTNKFQTTPMNATALQATITKYNSFVDAGKDADFNKAANLLKNKISTPPFYAAFSSPTVRDWYTGIHINGKCQVLDLDGNVIPALYGAGESVGGFTMHGLAKCFIFGRLAGTNAAAV